MQTPVSITTTATTFHRFFMVSCLLVLGLYSTTVRGQEPWTLQRCLDHAFEYNLQIKLAGLGEISADIGTQSAKGAFLPNLNGNASHGYNFGRTVDPFTNQFVESSRIQSNSFGLSTGMTLFNWSMPEQLQKRICMMSKHNSLRMKPPL